MGPPKISYVKVSGRSFVFPGGAPGGFIGVNSAGLSHYGTPLLAYSTPAHGYYEPDSNNVVDLTDTWFQSGYTTDYRSWVDQVVSALRNHPALLAWEVGNELKDVGNPGAFLTFATTMGARSRAADPNHPSEKGLSFETYGRECVLVTPRSESNKATGSLVIELPRSASSVSCDGLMAWRLRVSAISFFASAALSSVGRSDRQR